MAWTFCKDKPISRQIADRITIDILNNNILITQRLPDAVNMSRHIGTTVKSVEEAYRILLNDDIIKQNGSIYILNSDLTAAKNRRTIILRELITKFLSNIDELELPYDEMLAELKNEMLKNACKD